MKPITVQEAINRLNELNAYDGMAMAELLDKRVFCNKLLENHPTAQCGVRHGHTTIGLLGVLNGIFGDGTYGPIVAVLTDDEKRITRFELYKKP